ncbi:hypothetical protein, partial [Bacteroides uniformis]|uniref:hypothetical protein n=1 Tax=Bacteroides uniformis TaxID=820 RepID=UPI001AA132C2
KLSFQDFFHLKTGGGHGNIIEMEVSFMGGTTPWEDSSCLSLMDHPLVQLKHGWKIWTSISS